MALGHLGRGRCAGWWGGIQDLHGVGLGQPPRASGVVAVTEGEDVVGARELVNEVLDAAGSVQVGAAGEARGPLGRVGLGRALKEADTTSVQ